MKSTANFREEYDYMDAISKDFLKDRLIPDDETETLQVVVEVL